MTTTQSTTQTLQVPGATLVYDIRSNAATSEPILLLIGSPMGAAGFGTLAGHFGDRTVVTYDPRGADRSQKCRRPINGAGTCASRHHSGVSTIHEGSGACRF